MNGGAWGAVTMTMCVKSAVHVYHPEDSFVTNLLGWPGRRWLEELLGLREPGPFDFTFSCPGGYWGAAFGGSFYTIFAMLAAIAAGVALARRRRRGAGILAVLWALFSLAGMYADYSKLPDLVRSREHAEYVASYLIAMPVQLAANLLFVLTPLAGVTWATWRLFSAGYWAAVRRAEAGRPE